MSKKTLLLNASYEVLSFIPERKAFKLLCKDKVEVVSTWDDIILFGQDNEIKHPSILKLKKLVRRNYFNSNFSRKALVKRDKSTCFIPGTKILMHDGSLKSIEDISIGDLVIDHNGDRQCVEYIYSKYIDSDIMKIRVRGNGDYLFLTKDHKVLRTSWDHSSLDKEGVPVENIKISDYLFNTVYKRNNIILDGDLLDFNKSLPYLKVDDTYIKFYNSKKINRHFTYDFSLGRIIGLFLAEGTLYDKSISFCFHKKETYFVDEVFNFFKNTFGLVGKIRVSNKRNTRIITIFSKIISSMFRNLCFCNGVKSFNNKNYSDEFLRGLLLGILDGDGYYNFDNKKIVLMLKLDNLIRDILIISNMIGLYPTMSKTYFRKDGRRFKSLIFQSENYNLILNMKNISGNRWEKTKNSKNDRSVIDGKYIISKIQSIENIHYNGYVFDLQISNSHTYIANGICVHNCQYCNTKLTASEITIDHVLPRAQGGKTTFLNCVVCCHFCNNKKADNTPEEAKMTLLKKPTHPSFAGHYNVADPQKYWHDDWDDFLGYTY